MATLRRRWSVSALAALNADFCSSFRIPGPRQCVRPKGWAPPLRSGARLRSPFGIRKRPDNFLTGAVAAKSPYLAQSAPVGRKAIPETAKGRAQVTLVTTAPARFFVGSFRKTRSSSWFSRSSSKQSASAASLWIFERSKSNPCQSGGVETCLSRPGGARASHLAAWGRCWGVLVLGRSDMPTCNFPRKSRPPLALGSPRSPEKAPEGLGQSLSGQVLLQPPCLFAKECKSEPRQSGSFKTCPRERPRGASGAVGRLGRCWSVSVLRRSDLPTSFVFRKYCPARGSANAPSGRSRSSRKASPRRCRPYPPLQPPAAQKTLQATSCYLPSADELHVSITEAILVPEAAVITSHANHQPRAKCPSRRAVPSAVLVGVWANVPLRPPPVLSVGVRRPGPDQSCGEVRPPGPPRERLAGRPGQRLASSRAENPAVFAKRPAVPPRLLRWVGAWTHVVSNQGWF